MSFWDWKSGYRYQSLDTTAQPGSLDAEAGIMSSTFDRTGLRLICGEADKTSESHLTSTFDPVPMLISLQSRSGARMIKLQKRHIPFNGPRHWLVANSERLHTRQSNLQNVI